MTQVFRKEHLLAVVLLVVGIGFIYLEGPPPGFTGGFSEPTCQQCHFGNTLNHSSGELSIQGLEESVTPSTDITLTIRLTRNEMAAAGFQLSARTIEGENVGQWQPVDQRTQEVIDSTGIRYIEHTQLGSASEITQLGQAEWNVLWSIPDVLPDTVVFNLVGNAANGDDSPLGDYIFQKEIRFLTNQ